MTEISPSPAVLTAFKHWRTAEAAVHYAQPCPDVVMSGLTRSANQAIRELAAVPAENAADVVLKVFPLALIENDPPLEGNPFQPVHEAQPGTNFQESDLWRALIADLPAVSAIIAETVALPPCRYAVELAAKIAQREAE